MDEFTREYTGGVVEWSNTTDHFIAHLEVQIAQQDGPHGGTLWQRTRIISAAERTWTAGRTVSSYIWRD